MLVSDAPGRYSGFHLNPHTARAVFHHFSHSHPFAGRSAPRLLAFVLLLP
jgi:hypothetical protein